MQRFDLLPTGLGEIVHDIDRSGIDQAAKKLARTGCAAADDPASIRMFLAPTCTRRSPLGNASRDRFTQRPHARRATFGSTTSEVKPRSE
jgi:hypothetical protein